MRELGMRHRFKDHNLHSSSLVRTSSFKKFTTWICLIFNITGIAISWFGKKSTNSGLANSTATYTIDGGDPFPFELVYSPRLGAQPGLFVTQEYSYGNHTLHVMHNGNNGSIPLTLSSLIVQRVASINNAAGPALSTSTQVTVSPSPTQTQSHHRGLDRDKIIGIAGGILVFILIAVIVIAYLLRRRRRGVHHTSASVPLLEYYDSGQLVPDPFPAWGSRRNREPAKTSATVFAQFGSFSCDMEGVHRAGVVDRAPGQYPFNTPDSTARTDHGDNLGGNDESKSAV